MANVQLAIAGDETTQVILSVPGVQGPAGSNLPPSGTTNQVLYKQSNTDYDTAWKLLTNDNVDAAAAIAGTKISPNFGTQTVQTTGIFSHALGTAGAPTVTFTGDLNTGIYSPGADQVAISTAGNQRIEIQADGDVSIDGGTVFIDAGSNRLGVNTNNPAYELEVSSTGEADIQIDSGSGQDAALRFAENGTNAFSIFHDASASALSVYDNTALSQRLTIDSAGLVGIGTSLPDGLLTVRPASGNAQVFIRTNDTTSTSQLIFGDSADANVGGIQYSHTTNSLQFHVGNIGEKMTLDSSGRLLVGTVSTSTTATAVFQGNSGGGTSHAIINLARGATNPGINLSLGFTQYQDSAGSVGAQIYAQTDAAWSAGSYAGRLVFSVTPDGGSSPTTSPSAMTINSGQEVLIGYSADNGAYKLQVNSQIFATSATIATSDGRYKENVATLDGCVDLVKALRPVSFDWKHQEPITRINEEGETVVVREAHNFPDGTQVGFIAQEVEGVLTDKPWLGSVIKQNVRPAVTDNDGNELAPEEEFLGIAEGNLVAVLTSALKDAISRIESLEAEVAVLKA